MADVVTWSKLNKLKKMLMPWTTARAEKIDKIDTITANSETIKNTMAKDSTVAKASNLEVVNKNVDSLKNKNGMEEVLSNYHCRYYNGAVNANQTLLSVTGSGYLCFVSVAKNTTLRITIDDEVLTIKHTSGYYAINGAANTNYLGYYQGPDDPSPYICRIGSNSSTSYTFALYKKVNDTDVSSYTSGPGFDTGDRAWFAVTKEPLRFNKKLEIVSLTKDNGYDGKNVCYVLDK